MKGGKMEIQSLIGKKSGNLTVIDEYKKPHIVCGKRSGYTYYCLCKCSCGNIINVKKYMIIHNLIKSCKKCSVKRKKIRNQEGKRFGKLVVIKDFIEKNKRRYCLCLCDCGNYQEVYLSNLLSGRKKDCGCVARKKAAEKHYKHGGKGTKLYKVWCSMRKRCRSKSGKDYKDYFCRGISVCDEWEKDFSVFREWAISNGYKNGLTIDRIDNNGNYCPENCRWVDMKVQNRNKRNNIAFLRNGERKTISEIAEIYKLPYEFVRYRLKRPNKKYFNQFDITKRL